MANIFNNSYFSHSWRPYQQRVLDELETHLDDNHLHVIAAPGSGKTILGLEAMLRLNKPTLIFAPSIAIRNQWADRYTALFANASPELISKDIRNPKLITISTYQGLHAAYSGTKNKEEQDTTTTKTQSTKTKNAKHKIINTLKHANIGTIIVDEAHHLRSQWWKCLIDIKEKLDSPSIVALTATPPYDVSPQEWEKYKELCGPVDAEISIPELVKEHNLCPHQDYVYFSAPLQTEQNEIQEFRSKVNLFIQQLYNNTEFIETITANPHVQSPKHYIEDILSDPTFYSSIAIFLKYISNPSYKKLTKILGIKEKNLPSLSYPILENLLSGYLFTHAKSFAVREHILNQLTDQLKRFGAIEKRKVTLANPKTITSLLSTSVSKLDSIRNIVQLESSSLKTDLRMVILTDYIRKEDLPGSASDLQPLKRIGVVPIFEHLRRSNIPSIQLGILSGSLVIIPQLAYSSLVQLAAAKSISQSDIKTKPLPHDHNFISVDIAGTNKHYLVSIITELFNRGQITTLIGTASLLGEGWDAPSVNTLILASFVGSFMLSNQMRGRAIRTQAGNPTKTANIWHMVCVENDQTELAGDMATLIRRFNAFPGISYIDPAIETGFDRLGIDQPPRTEKQILSINSAMAKAALDRTALYHNWFEILELEDSIRRTDEFTCDPFYLPRSFVFTNSIIALFRDLLIASISLIIHFTLFMGAPGNSNENILVKILAVIFVYIPTFTFTIPSLFKTIYLIITHGPVASSLKQIGRAIIKSLYHEDLIKTPISKLKINAEKTDDEYGTGSIRISLDGGTTYEKSLFAESVKELLSPIDNPRYILIRKSFLGRLLRKDYHVVPKHLAKNKQSAEFFMKMWKKYVGPTQLIYTRTEQGRKTLLHARKHSLAASFQHKSELQQDWN